MEGPYWLRNQCNSTQNSHGVTTRASRRRNCEWNQVVSPQPDFIFLGESCSYAYSMKMHYFTRQNHKIINRPQDHEGGPLEACELEHKGVIQG